MMDRSKELALEYEQAANMLERFKNRQSLAVEGEWYLMERERREPLIKKMDMDTERWLFDFYRDNGWTVTPIYIFRK